ncbi:MAG: COX15/CtaA family protein [Isosphaeraceae bacterium]|nr:COX15/CtaA family protein [Isosphaeraceae bacterium]
MTPKVSAFNPVESRPAYRRGPHWVALFAAAFTLPLLFVGGSVTTYRFGLAVPDWPTTFHVNMFLYDFWNAPFGVRVEHTHRLYGAAVGLATIFLAVWFLAFERRRWMKGLGVLALATVIVQGVLGGTRVTQTSTLLAAVHGCMGQAFFGLMVALCVLTGSDWLGNAQLSADAQRLRRRSVVMVGLIYAQIALGAWLRHYGTVPALVIHAVIALAVWSHAAALSIRIERHKSAVPGLVPAARAMALAVTLQVVLGLAAWMLLLPFDHVPRPVSLWQAMVRTAHQTNGALLLGSAVVLALRACRHQGPAAATAAAPASTKLAPWNLETVA